MDSRNELMIAWFDDTPGDIGDLENMLDMLRRQGYSRVRMNIVNEDTVVFKGTG